MTLILEYSHLSCKTNKTLKHTLIDRLVFTFLNHFFVTKKNFCKQLLILFKHIKLIRELMSTNKYCHHSIMQNLRNIRESNCKNIVPFTT